MFSCRWCENLTHSFTGGVGVRDFTTSKNTLVKSHLQVREARTTPQQITAVVGRFPRILCGGQIGHSSKTMILCGQIGHSSKLWFHTLCNAMSPGVCEAECDSGSLRDPVSQLPKFFQKSKTSGSWRNKPYPPVSPILKKWIRRGNQSFCVSQVLCCFWHSGRAGALPKRRWP